MGEVIVVEFGHRHPSADESSRPDPASAERHLASIVGNLLVHADRPALVEARQRLLDDVNGAEPRLQSVLLALATVLDVAAGSAGSRSSAS